MSIHKDYRCAECGGELVNLEREALYNDRPHVDMRQLYLCHACCVTYRIKEWTEGETQHMSVSVEDRG